jgi:hypothetical protein
MIFIFILMVGYTACFSHELETNPVHQRIVYEAYKLLKLQFSKEYDGFADMSNHIGEIRDYSDRYWNDIDCITGGSDHEDRQDIVYNKSGFNVSSTHFWDKVL